MRLLLRAHLEQLRGVDSTALLGHIHAHETGERAALIFRGVLHGLRLRAHQMRRRHVRVAENGVLLQLLDHRLVLFRGFDGVYAKGHDLHAAQIRPLFGEHVVERGGDLRGVPRQRAVADAHLGNLCERGLKRGQQFALELAVNLLARVVALHIAADVRVKQHRVGHAIAVFAETANGNIHVQTDIAVHHAEGNRAGRSVFVAQDLLGVEEIDPLIPAGLTAEGKAVEGGFQNGFHLLAVERPVEDAGFAALFKDILARLGAEIDDFSLIHDHHALAVGHGDDAAVRNDVVVLTPAAAEAGFYLFLRFRRQHVVRQGIHIKILFPLAGQRAARRVQCSRNQSHSDSSCYFFCVLFSIFRFVVLS